MFDLPQLHSKLKALGSFSLICVNHAFHLSSSYGPIEKFSNSKIWRIIFAFCSLLHNGYQPHRLELEFKIARRYHLPFDQYAIDSRKGGEKTKTQKSHCPCYDETHDNFSTFCWSLARQTPDDMLALKPLKKLSLLEMPWNRNSSKLAHFYWASHK